VSSRKRCPSPVAASPARNGAYRQGLRPRTVPGSLLADWPTIWDQGPSARKGPFSCAHQQGQGGKRARASVCRASTRRGLWVAHRSHKSSIGPMRASDASGDSAPWKQRLRWLSRSILHRGHIGHSGWVLWFPQQPKYATTRCPWGTIAATLASWADFPGLNLRCPQCPVPISKWEWTLTVRRPVESPARDE
jgi:hypothetical protein